ncbi:MAG TPA: energy transducer TonB [Acidobacteriaceae bacterium]|jgi:TonB family protein|nr:energy transducer TonB [Acidobacteriaceae bacterium]
MPKPLRSDDPNPQPVQFTHFGVLNDGSRSKGAAITSVTVNVIIAALVVILGMVVRTNPMVAKKITELTLPPEPPKVAPAPKIPPPPPVKLPPPPKMAEPKIKLPEPVKLPDIKPVEVPTPKPVVLAPPPPKAVTPPPAPVKVNLGQAMPAAIKNNDAHPTAVRLGESTNPLKPLTGPAVAPVNMGSAGMPGMNAANTGSGARAVAVNMGSGSPNGSMNGRDNAAHVVAGVKLGVPGGTGPMNSRNFNNAPVQVQLQTAQKPVETHPQVQQALLASAPKVTYKPNPVYTEEAKAMHLEGNVSLRIRVTASGGVQVLGVVHGLGHGLDQSAIQATEATRFRPALDSTGHAIDWEGVVLVNFQMS